MPIPSLKPTSKLLVYDLVAQAGIDTGAWSNYRRPQSPASNPKYCYNWSFEGPDRIVVCLWFEEMQRDGDVIYRDINIREIAAATRLWSPNQRKRAFEMDHAIQLARLKRLPVRVIVVDGSIRSDADDDRRSHVEHRMLDPEQWHVARYDDETGGCRLQRGPWPSPPEQFSPAEITAAGTFDEGASKEVTARVRERSARLRDLARAHFSALSPDGRLHCSVCDWAPPVGLTLTSPIVEIHHGVGISSYPADGRSLLFDEAIQRLTPLCPNCHRILHAKADGGTYTVAELVQCIRRGLVTETDASAV